MQITASTVSLTVDDVTASSAFLTAHLGYEERMAADGFASLGRSDAAADIVLLRRGTEVLPADQRDRHADGLILAFTLEGGIAEEEARLRAEGVEITMPLREEPWGERLFQIADPNGVVLQFVEWATGAAGGADAAGTEGAAGAAGGGV
ncbi:VOC family protein [Streptomyces sp. NPDC006307]|uniref:VOC family protein n=1 Tax=Streptomyces sp. NPDC006307 TaxID=3156748 RepID=UPI00339DC637